MRVLIVSWFSAGVSSAVATWLMRDKVDKIIYTHIDDQHPDTMRFVKDCEQWFGKPVEILQSPLKSVENACRYRCYVNGARGAACSRMLKRVVRAEYECAIQFFNYFTYVWGMDCSRREEIRAERLREEMPQHKHIFPLIDYQISKKEAHGILAKAGIRRPYMYELGYPNNNCIGCVKGGKGYWNKVRVDFPDVFNKRAVMERLIGGTCLKKERENPDEPTSEDNTVRLYLDELNPKEGRGEQLIVPECGAMCEILNKASK